MIFHGVENLLLSQQALENEEPSPIKILQLIRKTISSRANDTALGRISSEPESTPFKVLISTILSARTRDSVTEQASTRLFQKYPDSKFLSKANWKSVVKLIKPVNFCYGKAKRIIEVAKHLEKEFGGNVPEKMDELLKLPGVGRKTANCVLVYALKKAAIPVDVHVHRISNRIGLVKTKTPEETEKSLSLIYDKKHWPEINELFVRFGQSVCTPRTPKCSICLVNKYCNYYKTSLKEGKRGRMN